MVYFWIIALRRNLFKDSLEEHLKKSHKNAKCTNLQFHNLKFSQERHFVLSCNYSYRHMYEGSNR